MNSDQTSCTYCKLSGHSVKNEDGTVICPLLLDTTCRFCHEKGHTIKKCKNLRQPYDPNYRIKKSIKRENDEDRNICTDMYERYGNFWPLLVEGTRDDNHVARRIRHNNDASEMRKDFRTFLYDNYRTNWLYRSEHSKHDCAYLEHLRDLEIENDREREMYKRRRIMNQSRNDDFLNFSQTPNNLSSNGLPRSFNNIHRSFDDLAFDSFDLPNDSRLNNYISNKRKL
jgi:hypothetical protein